MKGKEGDDKYAPWKGRMAKAAFASTWESLEHSRAEVAEGIIAKLKKLAGVDVVLEPSSIMLHSNDRPHLALRDQFGRLCVIVDVRGLWTALALGQPRQPGILPPVVSSSKMRSGSRRRCPRSSPLQPCG